MLQALGLKSTLITDGKTPINLFSTANGLIGGMMPRKRRSEPEEEEEYS
jgi:major vault protein